MLVPMRWSVLRLLTPLAAAVTLYSAQADAAPRGAVPGQLPPLNAQQVVAAYADMARDSYARAAKSAREILTPAIDAFLAAPSTASLKRARDEWKSAHDIYLFTEAYRFGNPAVDELEPRVNSWPLDEGLIDYVAPSYGATSDENPLYTLNVIAHPKIRVGAKQIDASRIDKALLRQLQEAEGVTANVATGFHAIEFLLWGQDLHGTGPGAGERPYTDYDGKHCTHGNCDRRTAYLRAATALLVADLTEMENAWGANGKARKDLLARKPDDGLAVILTGLGSLSYGEMAGERMKLGLILHDPEEEQDCFSDNTHSAHWYDENGIVIVWGGGDAQRNYRPGEIATLRSYAQQRAPDAARRLNAAMEVALVRLRAIKEMGDSGRMAYDQMIGPNNPAGNKLVQDAIDAMVAQTHAIEGVVRALHLNVQLRDRDKFENAGR